MGEQADPSDGTPVPVASPVSGASPALAVSPVPRKAAAPGDGRESALLRAREALIAAADALCEAHDYAGAARTLRVALGRWPDGDPGRLAVIDRLARCAELCSEHAAAIELLESLADGYRESGDVMSLAAVQRRLATAHELRGDWAAALAAREAAAASFGQAGQSGEAATDRLAVAAHLRGAARYSPALSVLDLVLADARASGRADLTLRAEGLRGNVLSRLGRPDEGVPAVQASLEAALALRELEVAAELQQRLADSLEHGGDYDGAATAYRAAYLYCDTHGADAVGHLCRACATAVLFNRGEWSLAADVCADVLGETGTAAHPRAVSGCLLGLIHALRGAAADARPLLAAASGLSARIELTAVMLLSAWGLAAVEAQAGAVAAATDRIRQALALIDETQERHYCVPFLQWAATFCATRGLTDDAAACAAALSGICTTTGQAEATAALAHALGETRLADDPAGAAAELERAAGMFGELELPFAEALARQRAAAALLRAGNAPAAKGLLRAARSAAQRLGARPLLDDCEAALRGLGATALARTAEKPPRALAGLTAREMDVMVLVAAGNTSREVGAALFISPRTVEMHVQGCLLKLGCRTRAEAVRKLTELGALAG
jgi:DNA-binding CsgD family transcriptional regulator/tetratricopeptide (TPR) repeat protein